MKMQEELFQETKYYWPWSHGCESICGGGTSGTPPFSFLLASDLTGSKKKTIKNYLPLNLSTNIERSEKKVEI